MEFKKREVKIPTPQPQQDGMPEQMPDDIPPPHPEYSFEDKMLIVTVVCEVFDMAHINESEVKCPVSSMGRNYIQETRQRNIMYNISEGADTLRQITRYWNEWKGVGVGLGKKVNFAIRSNTRQPTNEL